MSLTLGHPYTLDGITPMRLISIKGSVAKFQMLNRDGSDFTGSHPNHDNQTRGIRIVIRRMPELKPFNF